MPDATCEFVSIKGLFFTNALIITHKCWLLPINGLITTHKCPDCYLKCSDYYSQLIDIHFRELWLAPVTRDIQDIVDFGAEVKMTGSAHAKNRKKFTLYCFLENKVHFYPIMLVNTKTTTPPSGSVLNARYIAPRFASYYIYISTTIFTSPLGDCC